MKINRPVFDMIRTLAIAMVFTIHFLEHRNVPVPGFVFNFFTHCAYGVAMFFAMSGYLIMQSVNGSRNLKEYFLKRVSKIVPAYFAILIFAIIVWDLWLGQMPKDSLLGLGWIRYFLFLNAVVPSNEYYFWNDLWGLWTMSCFMLYYLLAPLIKKYVKNFRQSLVLLAFTILMAYAFKFLYLKVIDHAGIPSGEFLAGDSAVFNLISFAFGTAAFYAVREGKTGSYMSMLTAGLFFFLAIRTDSYNRIIWSVLTVMFMMSMKDFEYNKHTQWIGKTLDFCARYSFAAYLVHMPVIGLLEYYSTNVRYIGVGGFLVLSLALTAVAAAFLHNFVEKPFSNVIKKCFGR